MRLRAFVVASVVVVMLASAVASIGAPATSQAAGDQFVWFGQTMTHRANAYAQPTTTAPSNWASPVDYASGRVFMRLEILSKPSSLLTGAQICVWRNTFVQESCSPVRTFSSVGVYWFDFGTPNSWWKKNGTWSWTTPFSPTRIMLKDVASGRLLMNASCGASCYTGTALTTHVPISMRADAIVVAAGSSLVPPVSWAGCPAAWSSGCGGPVDPPGTTTTVPGVTSTMPPVTTTLPPVTTTVPPGGGSGTVALISSSAQPAPADRPLRQRLEAAGFTVRVIDDDKVATTQFDDVDLIVISATVVTNAIPLSLKTLDVPILSNDAPVSVRLGLGTAAGASSGTSLSVTTPSSPLADGRSGTVAVAASSTFTGLQPSGGATTVARPVGSAKAGIFTIDDGDSLTSGSAPARRVGFFLGVNAPARLNSTGWELFDAAVAWALGGTSPPPTTTTTTTTPPPPTTVPVAWADAERSLRVPVSLQSAAVPRPATVVDVAVDLHAAAGAGAPVSPSSLRVVEVDGSGNVVDSSIDAQFDQRAGASPGVGQLSIRTEATTSAGVTRRYHVYFERTGVPVTPVVVAPLVSVSSGIDAGQDSFLIDTPAGDWAYHKQGAGFSSLVDRDGNDWLGYSTAAGSAGEYRGVPNMVYPAGHFHPGASTATTQLIASGPLRVTLRSTAPGGWTVQWDIFPDRAHMHVVAAPSPYWFLYEGTPGGQIDATDLVVRPTGAPTALATAWTGDLAAPEYVGFVDPLRDRSVVVVHHENDAAVDSYRLMQNNMTVFGFGRDKLVPSLTGANHSFSVALVESDATTVVRETAVGLGQEFGGTVGSVEQRPN